jgi:deazaflavin-dependent oxidoreductase (nitroreductase family)
MSLDPVLADADYCYLTTTGRVTGEPRTIEIWFWLSDSTLYMLSGGRDRSDWVKNARKTPAVRVRIGERTLGRAFDGIARTSVSGDEDARARRAVAAKYRARGFADLDDWERDALVVAVDFTESRD